MTQSNLNLHFSESDETNEDITDFYMPDIEQYIQQVFYVLGSLLSLGKEYDFLRFSEAEAFIPLSPHAIGSEMIHKDSFPLCISPDFRYESFVSYMFGMCLYEARQQAEDFIDIGPEAIDIHKLGVTPF